MSTSNASLEAQAMYELKQRALKYYEENGVPEKMEEILNATFYDDPKDVYGHLVNFLDQFSKPSLISKIKAYQVLDSRSQPAVQADVYCIVRNNEQCVSSMSLSGENRVPEHGRLEDQEAEERERQQFVAAAIDLIEGVLTEKLTEADPVYQDNIDSVLCNTIDKLREEEEERIAREKEEAPELAAPPSPAHEPERGSAKKGKSPKGKGKGSAAVPVIPDEALEKLLCGSNAVAALSQAICQAAANIKRVPLYEHIAQLRFGEVPERFTMPQPMVTILASGKAYPGKLNCVKEYMIVPRENMPLSESVKHVSAIYNHIAKSLVCKGGVIAKCPNDLGALCPTLERPEQGLDMIQDAITHIGLTAGEDFYIVLNCAGREIFDYEKGKYEVITGQSKSFEDSVEFWADILERYPSVIGLIDPFRKQEKNPWMRLSERISERCFIMGDTVFHRPGLLKDEEMTPDFQTSAIVLHIDSMNTVTDILEVAKKFEDLENAVVLCGNLGDAADTLIPDMAVGMKARFIKVGAPCRGERVAKLNRLVQIESQLLAKDCLSTWDNFNFLKITQPAPPITPTDNENQEVESDANKKAEPPAKKA